MTTQALRCHAWSVPTDHPCFVGHFPGQPILPGVLLLATLTEAMLADDATASRLGAAPCLAAVKFLSPCLPGDVLRFSWHGDGDQVAFEARRVAGPADAAGDALVASGRYRPASA